MDVETRSALPEGGLLLIDGGCGFCQRTKAWIERHSDRGVFAFGTLESDEGRRWLARCGRDPEDTRTVVLVQERDGDLRCSDHSTAVLRVLRHMRRPYRWAYVGIWVPRPLRDLVYKLVSKNRHRF